MTTGRLFTLLVFGLLVLHSAPAAAARSRQRLHRLYGVPQSPPTKLPNVTLGPVEVIVDWPTMHCKCEDSPGCTDPGDPGQDGCEMVEICGNSEQW